MANCTPASTPVDTKPKTSSGDGQPFSDPSFYRNISSALQYLSLTRPDITYIVNQVYLHMHSPQDSHWNLVMRILRYVQGTSEHDIHLSSSPTHDLVTYSGADWVGCPDTRLSTSRCCVFLGDSLVSWSSKRRQVVS